MSTVDVKVRIAHRIPKMFFPLVCGVPPLDFTSHWNLSIGIGRLHRELRNSCPRLHSAVYPQDGRKTAGLRLLGCALRTLSSDIAGRISEHAQRPWPIREQALTTSENSSPMKARCSLWGLGLQDNQGPAGDVLSRPYRYCPKSMKGGTCGRPQRLLANHGHKQ